MNGLFDGSLKNSISNRLRLVIRLICPLGGCSEPLSSQFTNGSSAPLPTGISIEITDKD